MLAPHVILTTKITAIFSHAIEIEKMVHKK